MQVRILASRLKMMRDAGKHYVPLLGAGCSYNSGVKPTPQMKQEIAAIVTGDPKCSLDGFDEIWRGLSSHEQEAAIKQHFEGKTPSQGYFSLASLASQGFFDLVLTTNFDDLLERALEQRPLSYGTFVVGVDDERALNDFLNDDQWSVHLLKLHGDYRRSHYKYSLDALLEFHPDVKEVFARVSRLDMIICGYAFNDLDILRAFDLEEGSIYFVNLEQPNRLVRELLRKKNSENNSITGGEGDFDRLFRQLDEAVKRNC